jgi:hypothetical protein
LQDGQLGIEAGRVVGGERIGQTGEPIGHQRRDLGLIEFAEDLLQAQRVFTGEDPVVQCLEGDLFLGQLPLGIRVVVETDPGGVGEVGGKLDEQRRKSSVTQSRRTSRRPWSLAISAWKSGATATN